MTLSLDSNGSVIRLYGLITGSASNEYRVQRQLRQLTPCTEYRLPWICSLVAITLSRDTDIGFVNISSECDLAADLAQVMVKGAI